MKLSDKEVMNITIENITTDQKEQLIKLFSKMNWCGSIGASRTLKVFVDGDGAFRSVIKLDGKIIVGTEVESSKDESISLE